MVGMEQVLYQNLCLQILLKCTPRLCPFLDFCVKHSQNYLSLHSKKMYGHKLVSAAKESGLKRCRKWYRRNHSKRCKYLRHAVTGWRFLKKSRRKNRHLRGLLRIYMNENTFVDIFFFIFDVLLAHFFSIFFLHFGLLSHFKIIRCIVD